MQRSVSDLLNQQANNQINLTLPQVKKLKVPVVDVLFPSHQLVIVRQGYGKQIVRADPSLDFGTWGRPKITSNGLATIEYSDATNSWLATAFETTNRCVPTTPAHVPNITPTSSKPVASSSIIFEPFRVDTNFNPHTAHTGSIPATKMPPVVLPPGSSGGGGGTDKTPRLITQHPYLTSAFTWSNYGGVVVGGGLIVIFDYDTSVNHLVFTILDITNPSAPILLSQTTLTGTNLDCSPKLAGNYLYLMVGTPAIKIYDIMTDPTSPSLKSTTNLVLPTLAGDFALFANGTSIYIATQEFTGGGTAYIKVYDVTNASVPVGVVGSLTGFANNISDGILSTFCDGIFYTNGSATNGVFDLTTPTAPALLGTVGATLGGAMSAVHKRLFIADSNNSPNKIYIYDTTTPATPSLITSFKADPTITNPQPIGLLADGRFVYVNTCASTNRLFVWDVKTPATPVLVGQCDIANQNCPLYGLAVSGNHIYYRNIGEMTYGLNAPMLEIAGM